jgi:hypothetical protein
MVTLLAAGAVLVVVVLVGVVVLTAGKTETKPDKPARAAQPGTARETAEAYLEALANGDADAALAYGKATPASKQFLTDDILRKQIEMSPITDIRVTEASAPVQGLGMAPQTVLEASANFGDEYSQAQLVMRKFREEWQFDNSFIQVKIGVPSVPDKAIESLTIFGVPTGGANSVYVFPGPLDLKSSSRFVDVETEPILLEAMNSGQYGMQLMPKVTLNDEGRIASKEAVDTRVRNCANPNPPPDCPKFEYPPEIDPASVRFKGTEGLEDMTTIFNEFDMTNTVVGSGEVVVDAQTASGPTVYTMRLNVNGTVDLMKDPPVYTPYKP